MSHLIRMQQTLSKDSYNQEIVSYPTIAATLLPRDRDH